MDGETRTDSERLDWLEQAEGELNNLLMPADMDDPDNGEPDIRVWQVYDRDGLPIPPTGEHWKNARAAVDAAMDWRAPEKRDG